MIKTEGNTGAVIALIDSNHGVRESVFLSGAWDYITVPIIASELLVRVKSCLCLNHAKNHLASQGKHHPGPDDQGIEKTRDSEVELVQKACQYLLEDLSVNHSREELAYKVGTNRNKLAQAAKHVLGMGIFRWLIGERMKEAKRLCKTTDLSIQEIGYRV
ncbi:MAG: AraC family transcriptional regulator [Proteobacteria bacterium]|nr:AraC family transcriptional regulator [Pseudomonadota bacterium]